MELSEKQEKEFGCPICGKVKNNGFKWLYSGKEMADWEEKNVGATSCDYNESFYCKKIKKDNGHTYYAGRKKQHHTTPIEEMSSSERLDNLKNYINDGH